MQTANTPLTPFWDASGTRFWTSAQIRDTTTFGYAYPETQQWRYPDYPTYQAAIRRAVTTLYGTNVFANFVANVESRREEHAFAMSSLVAALDGEKEANGAPVERLKAAVPENGQAAEGAQKPLAASAAAAAAPPAIAAAAAAATPLAVDSSTQTDPIPASLKHLAPSNKYHDWIVNVRAQKHGLNQSFRVLVFLGPFNESDPSTWDTEFNCVGRVSVLARSATETQCAKCRVDAAEELMVSGTVPLTSALLQDITEGEVASLKPDDVVPHLRAKLAWKVTLFDGEERDVLSVPGLKVSVASTEVTIGEEDGLPVYSGEYTVYPEITEGKPAGLAAGEHI
jgi:tyrosinase